MRLKITLDFEVVSAPELAMAHLRGLLGALERHQDLGLRIGPWDLRDAGIEGVRLLSAQVEDTGTGGDSRRRPGGA